MIICPVCYYESSVIAYGGISVCSSEAQKILQHTFYCDADCYDLTIFMDPIVTLVRYEEFCVIKMSNQKIQIEKIEMCQALETINRYIQLKAFI